MAVWMRQVRFFLRELTRFVFFAFVIRRRVIYSPRALFTLFLPLFRLFTARSLRLFAVDVVSSDPRPALSAVHAPARRTNRDCASVRSSTPQSPSALAGTRHPDLPLYARARHKCFLRKHGFSLIVACGLTHAVKVFDVRRPYPVAILEFFRRFHTTVRLAPFIIGWPERIPSPPNFEPT